jgi:hypothetical protein
MPIHWSFIGHMSKEVIIYSDVWGMMARMFCVMHFSEVLKLMNEVWEFAWVVHRLTGFADGLCQVWWTAAEHSDLTDLLLVSIDTC